MVFDEVEGGSLVFGGESISGAFWDVGEHHCFIDAECQGRKTCARVQYEILKDDSRNEYRGSDQRYLNKK